MTGPSPAAAGPREPVGLIACAGRFPIVFAEKARECGIPVVCLGVFGMADPTLRHVCHEFHPLRRLSLGAAIRTFRRGGVRRWTMAGKFHKHLALRPWRLVEISVWGIAKLAKERDHTDGSTVLWHRDAVGAGVGAGVAARF